MIVTVGKCFIASPLWRISSPLVRCRIPTISCPDSGSSTVMRSYGMPPEQHRYAESVIPFFHSHLRKTKQMVYGEAKMPRCKKPQQICCTDSSFRCGLTTDETNYWPIKGRLRTGWIYQQTCVADDSVKA
ncbi:hypothetical protein KCP75_09520 [Salmonella enterica subsp. enterica]|nr:hypothetical protein KCP75_09520 [Salmonella enterica subsp. enterica]